MKKIETEICIVGGGLCGSLLAIRLAEEGHDVLVLEKRQDLRWADIDAGRSINLALSDRGLKALSGAGVDDEALKISIPMFGRKIHGVDGELRFSAYSGRQDEYINSISRSGLNAILLDTADRYDNVQILFETSCLDVDIDHAKLWAQKDDEEYEIQAQVLFGTDGAGSVVRQRLEKHLGDDFRSDVHWLSSGYKELHIPPGDDGEFRIEKNALHIWPRGSFMTIALPNLDGSFTVTLFWPWKGEYSFEAVNEPEQVIQFFENHFGDLLPHLPDLQKDYFDNPSSSLGTLKCAPWNHRGRLCLMGDACHPIVPFYGQGMNAAFEDVSVFMDIYHEAYRDHGWQDVFEKFSASRKVDTDAIADLAIDNFYEMQDKVDDPDFIAKRQLEHRLEAEMPDYYSKYSLVTFREDLSYDEAMRRGRKQDELLLKLCKSGDHLDMSLNEVLLWLDGQMKA